jgi:steroid 5-alpha reductase family enzyme
MKKHSIWSLFICALPVITTAAIQKNMTDALLCIVAGLLFWIIMILGEILAELRQHAPK